MIALNSQTIVFTAPGRAELLPVEVPRPEADQILVRLAFSTVSSGTERANLAGDPNVSIASRDGAVHFPRYLGYSSSGTVVETGAQVASVQPGDRVAVSWGRHSQYLLLGENNVHKIGDNVSIEEAAAALIGTFPLAAVRKCRLEIGEPAVVMGLGILGLIGVQLLRAAGAVPVIAVDPVERQRQRALHFGADWVLNPYEEGFVQKVRSLTGGGAKVAVEVTGAAQALDQVLDCMAPLGRVALLGCTRRSDFAIDYYHKVHGPGISLIGAHTLARPRTESSPGLWTDRDDISTLLHLLEGGRISWEKLAERRCSPLEAPAVYRELLESPSFPITQFDWTVLEGDPLRKEGKPL